jgi:PAS domain-containing protein
MLARFPHRVWRRVLVVLMAGLAALILVILVANVQRPSVILSLVVALAACMAAFGFALTRVSHQLRREQTVTRSALLAREEEFRQIAGNIQEVFWMIDGNTKKPLYVNEAYEAITGRSCRSLMENPSSNIDAIHPDDRSNVLSTQCSIEA